MSKILIVDDQPHVHEYFSAELGDEGYEVVSASDAADALGRLKDLKPDLVILDLYLNKFEGWDLLRDMKAKCPHLPVLIVTAYDTYENDPRGSQADGYVIKNFHAAEQLKQKVAKVLQFQNACPSGRPI